MAAIESGRDSIEGTVPEEVKIVQETYENQISISGYMNEN